MATITVSRQLGSEGNSIARQVAQTLGYHLVDKNTMEQVLNEYGLVQFREIYDSAPGFWSRFNQLTLQTVQLLNQVILALARHGEVVIVGRGSFAVLSGFADVLNVRVQAPLAIRVGRVMAREQMTEPDQAEALVRENDAVRTAFIESFYGLHWGEAAAFDLVIDTGKVAPALAATWLVQAFQALPAGQAGAAPTSDAIEVDPVLARAIATTLERQRV